MLLTSSLQFGKSLRCGRRVLCNWLGCLPAKLPESSESGSSTVHSLTREGVARVQMKIAIIGTRGIPARYGGFETFAEQLSKRLVTRGHQVTVYCRRCLMSMGSIEDAGNGISSRALSYFFASYWL